ncbi:hypothetical protein BpHYR1_016312 [Brachionus plicatilis]|uniref:Uncharacterized protein n=1 Tax=Brachionus plicatilis TaxID=10195 RepID=A0A3M7SHB0_BRAPC|nr:hypothetical protein BpHYR1_016312 [Brachionus plicatilis]
MSDSNKLDEKSSSSNILPISSAPSSINDPNDEIWIEFLNSLNQQPPSGNSAEKNSEQNPNSDEKPTDDEQTVDNDDAADDPDFTVCLENCDLEDPYYPDACFQVPKKEAVELVKDAIEICDGAPIVYDDKRHSKIKSAITIKKLTPENRTKILINRVSKLGGTVEPKASTRLAFGLPKITIPTPTKEFVPEFTEIQRKKLDEQLRNVQLNSDPSPGFKILNTEEEL